MRICTAPGLPRQYHDGFIKQFVKAIYGGALLTFGCNLALVVGSSPALQASDPGLAKILFAVVFPVGLIMISLLGMELVTSCAESSADPAHDAARC